MANGDKAGAAGLRVFAQAEDARLGYDYLNVRGDELATHMATGTHTIAQIPTLQTKLNAKVDQSDVELGTGVIVSRATAAGAGGPGQLTVNEVPTLPSHAASKQYTDTHLRELRGLVDELAARVRQLERGA